MLQYDECPATENSEGFHAMAWASRTALEQAGPAQSLSVRMVIEGGVDDERYDFEFEASSQGVVRADMSSRGARRRIGAAIGALSRTDIVDLLHAAEAAHLAEARRPPVRLPAHALIGRLDIRGGAHAMSFVFMADPEQARRAGLEPPREVAALVERVFDVSTKGVGL